MKTFSDQILKALLQTFGRTAFPQEKVVEIIGRSEKNQKAYMLCDGTKTPIEIVKKTKLDSGNFSRTLGKWEEEGIIFKLTDGKEIRPLHIYPLKSEHFKKGNKQ